MLSAWLMLRQVEEAIRGGRLQEASHLLEQPEVQGHRKAERLCTALGLAYLERAARRFRQGDWRAAWDDLTEAERRGCHSEKCLRLKAQIQQAALEEVRRMLEAREPRQAVQTAAEIRQRKGTCWELDLLEQAANEWLRAEKLARRGEFGPAVAVLERLFPANVRAIRDVCREWIERQGEAAEAVGHLQRAVQAQRWREVIEWADRLLGVAPDHVEAAKLRDKAWQALEPPTVVSALACPPRPAAEEEPDDGDRRFLLWIDGVGGYLVCLAERVSLGQSAVDIPLLADVSRLHAYLARDEEAYLLEALRPTRVNDQEVFKAVLNDGDLITLGTTCRLRFRLPVAGSLTARLEFASNHRLPVSLDGVILLAEACLLGPAGQAHIAVPDLNRCVALFRGPSGWGVRMEGEFTVNGAGHREQAMLDLPATVSGTHFRFCLESVKAAGIRL